MGFKPEPSGCSPIQTVEQGAPPAPPAASVIRPFACSSAGSKARGAPGPAGGVAAVPAVRWNRKMSVDVGVMSNYFSIASESTLPLRMF